MRDFFESVRFKILLAVTALLIGVMIHSATTGGFASGGEYIIGVIFDPLKKLSAGISQNISTSLDMVINAERYYNENKQLKEQLNAMYNRMIDYDELMEENGDLRSMLALSEEYDSYAFSPPCSVIARTTNDPYASFTVDKGSDSGIEPGDPVITMNGIVGVCFDVTPGTCKVRTLYSPKTSMGAYTVRTKATGIVSGGYEAASGGRIRMNYIPKDSDVVPGDIVVTSGSSNFPAGQLIGVVESVAIEDSGLSRYAVIIPVEDPKVLTGVFVVTDYQLDEATAVKIGESDERS